MSKKSTQKAKSQMEQALDAATTEEELNGTPSADAGGCCGGSSNSSDSETETTGTNVATIEGEEAVPMVATPEGYTRKSDTSFDKLLITVSSTGKAYREAAHEAAMQALVEAGSNNNYARLTALYEILVVKNEQKQLVAWSKQYGTIRLATTEKEGEQFRIDRSDSANAFNYIGADASPFWSVELFTHQEILDKLYGVEDIRKRIETIIKDVENMEAGTTDKKRIDPEQVSDVIILKDMLKDVVTRTPMRKAA